MFDDETMNFIFFWLKNEIFFFKNLFFSYFRLIEIHVLIDIQCTHTNTDTVCVCVSWQVEQTKKISLRLNDPNLNTYFDLSHYLKTTICLFFSFILDMTLLTIIIIFDIFHFFLTLKLFFKSKEKNPFWIGKYWRF